MQGPGATDVLKEIVMRDRTMQEPEATVIIFQDVKEMVRLTHAISRYVIGLNSQEDLREGVQRLTMIIVAINVAR